MKYFQSKGLATAYICAEDDGKDERNIYMRDGVIAGDYQLVYFTPESLLTRKRRKIIMSNIYKKRVHGLIIDEAHIIKKW